MKKKRSTHQSATLRSSAQLHHDRMLNQNALVQRCLVEQCTFDSLEEALRLEEDHS